MDQRNVQEWIREAHAAMEDAAREISPAIDLMARQAAILEIGMRAVAKAVVRDTMQEAIAKMIAEVLPSDGGASPLGFHRGGLVKSTAVRRVIQ